MILCELLSNLLRAILRFWNITIANGTIVQISCRPLTLTSGDCSNTAKKKFKMPLHLCFKFFCRSICFFVVVLVVLFNVFFFQRKLEISLLGLGPRYLFNHYPGHWIPPSFSFTQGLAMTLSYPWFHSCRHLRYVFTVLSNDGWCSSSGFP